MKEKMKVQVFFLLGQNSATTDMPSISEHKSVNLPYFLKYNKKCPFIYSLNAVRLILI